MKDLADRASRYNLSASADWQAVLTSFELGTGFQFIVLLVIDEDGAEACRTELSRRLESTGKRLLEIPTGSRDELENIADPLLHTSPPPDTGAVWVSRVVHEADPEVAAWRKSWTKAVAHLNQYRNPFRRAWKVPVVFVGAPWLQVVLRENAPDVWSVRTTVAVVEPVPQAVLAEPPRMMATAPAGRGPDPEMALAEVEKLRASGAPELAIARMLYRAGLGFAARYQWHEAQRAFAECLEIRLRSGPGAEDLADVHAELGYTLAWLSDYEAAHVEYQEALRLCHQLNNAAGEARCLFGLGEVALWRSCHEEAGQRFESALALYRQTGDALGEATCIKSLGDIATERSSYSEARTRYEVALALYRRAGSVLGQANCIASLGDIALDRSDHAEARQRYETALPLFRQVGSVLGEAHCVKGLGEIALRCSDHSEAQQRFEAALALYRLVGDVLGQANCVRSLGDIAFARSGHDQAEQLYAAALALFGQVGNVLGEANCFRSLGDIALPRSVREARSAYEKALAVYQRFGDPSSIGGTHRRLAHIADDPSDRARHIQAAREAWLSINRSDLIKQLDDEFGAPAEPASASRDGLSGNSHSNIGR
jgi:tetratricopeptide (TPR) repeat protein